MSFLLLTSNIGSINKGNLMIFHKKTKHISYKVSFLICRIAEGRYLHISDFFEPSKVKNYLELRSYLLQETPQNFVRSNCSIHE